MKNEKMLSGKRLMYWLFAIALVAVLAYALIKFFNVFGQQGPCVAPENLQVVSSDTSAISIQWQRSTNALQYRVEIRDSVNLDAIVQDTVVTDTSYTFQGLEKGHGYAMSVRALCLGDSSSVVRIGGATQGRIIIEDIAHYNGSACPESCETAVALNSNCFSWVSAYGEEFYQVDIIDNSSIPVTTVVRFHFVKNRANGTNDLYIWMRSQCSVFTDTIGVRPNQCTPGGASLCGVIGTSVNYQLDFDLGGGCVVLPSGYSAMVKRCLTDQ